MRFRNLRVVWSVLWGLVAVLLIMLWVRSYWRRDVVRYESSNWNTFIISNYGELYFGRARSASFSSTLKPSRSIYTPGTVRAFPLLWFEAISKEGGSYVGIPYLFSLTLAATIAAAPWFRSRFSLRSLLIVTTLVAIALGAIVYALR